jgi:F-type H+-transporting ATPase subunit b
VVGGIAFIVLCFVLMKFVFPRMEQTFQARVDAIEGGIKRAEAARIRDEARADAVGIREDMLAKAREESDRIIAAGREALQTERQTIVRQLRAEIGELAVDLAGRIVGEALEDEARRRGTVTRFLAELGEGGAAPAAAGGRR